MNPLHVFHYTTAGGLAGILQTHSLHATHCFFLNDPGEIFFGKLVLERLLRRSFQELIDTGSIQASCVQVNKVGNPITDVNELAFDYAGKTLTDYFQLGEPYITAFCRHSDAKHDTEGILSQWRTYGVDGGYAIEFETAGLNEMMVQERDRFRYAFFPAVNPVFYGNPDKVANNIGMIPGILEAVKNYVLVRYPPNSSREDPRVQYKKSLDSLMDMIFKLSPVLFAGKSEGFDEEKESRIVCGPLAKDWSRLLPDKQEKEVHFRIRDGAIAPYVKLFENSSQVLPIRRIMVGPHTNQSRRCHSVKLLCKENGYEKVDVVASTIQVTSKF